jgi:hypothetical protein
VQRKRMGTSESALEEKTKRCISIGPTDDLQTDASKYRIKEIRFNDEKKLPDIVVRDATGDDDPLRCFLGFNLTSITLPGSWSWICDPETKCRELAALDL